MKEIKLVHLVIAGVLVLLAVAILQWIKLPQSAPAASVSSAITTPPTTELPPLPQNDLDPLNAPPSFTEELPPFKESPGGNLEPKDKATSNRKAML